MPGPANALDITAAGLVKFDGVNVFSGETTTNHNVLIGAASNGVTSVAPSATTGVPLISQGAAVDPAFGTVSVAGGGTGATTLTGILTGNGTSAITATAVTNHATLVGGASNSITSLALGTSGQVLVSNGAGADPSYQTLSNSNLPGSGQITLNNGTNVSVTGSPVALGAAATINVSGPPSATTLTSNGVVYGQGASAMAATAAGSTNQVLLGNTGSAPSFGAVPNAALANSSVTLNSGNNITITGSPLSLGGSATVNVSGTTNHAIQVGNASGSLTSVSVGATGTILNGHTGADPSFDTQTVGSYTFTKSTAASGTIFTVSQTDNTSGLSDATIMAQTGGASGGDSILRVAQGTSQSYCMGIDHTDSTNKSLVFKSGANGTAAPSSGDTTIMSFTKGGVMSLPQQAAGQFNVHTPTGNVTGDGTVYTVIFDQISWQQGANYNTGTGTYTVPITGVYTISGIITLSGLTSSHTSAELKITGSGGALTRQVLNPTAIKDGSTNATMNFSASAYYAASATIYITISVSGGTKVVSVLQDSSGNYSTLTIVKIA